MTWTFKYKVKIKAHIEQVFAYFATLDGMNKWFVRDGILEPHVGGRFLMLWDNDQKMDGEVVEFQPNKLFAFRWKDKDPNLCTIAAFHFEILEDGRTQVSIEDGEFPEEVRYAKDYSSVSEGWTTCLLTLKGVIDYGIDLRD